MKHYRNLLLILLVVFTAGCNTFNRLANRDAVEPATEDQIIPLEHADLVSMNLVFALSQLREVNPRQTTVQFIEPKTLLGRVMEKRLRDAGYGVQRVTSDVGSNFVRYQYQNSITEAGPITRYSLSIGFVEADRNYIVKNDAVFPDSEMMISGAAEVLVKNNDEIFKQQGESHRFASETLFDSSSEPELVVMNASGTAQANIAADFAASIRKNLHDNNEISNYAALFRDYTDVRNAVLIFPNDKLTVGVNNKKVLRSFARAYNPATDIVSVIGCSHGKTNLRGGNVALATGRAHRVKEELIFANVPYDQIYEEGCWGSVIHEEFPSRGVVVTLKRKNS